MQTGYFSAAWNDIKNSPGWFGKLAVLSLVGLIPVFGWIVVFGYLFGWARDVAWNVHAPMPARIFGNEDGKLYSRGFFALVIGLVCMLIPWVLEFVWAMVTGIGANWSGYGYGYGGTLAFFGLFSSLFSVVVFAGTLFAVVFAAVGIMRMSIYGRLAPGLQFGKIWAMIRHDFGGLARILGMALLLWVVAGFVISVVTIGIMLAGLAIGLVAGIPVVHTDSPAVLFAALPGLLALIVVLAVACGVLSMMLSVFVLAMVSRALGYWTRQFEVPAWRGQDDPMPFEIEAAQARAAGQQPPR